MTRNLTDHVVLPVANEADARTSVAALEDYPIERLTVVHVIEKAAGAPDKASVEQREQFADELFEIVADELADESVDVETEYRYATDVAEAIIDAAAEHDASAIVYTPRGGSRLMKLLTGDVTSDLLDESHVPAIAMPKRERSGGDP